MAVAVPERPLVVVIGVPPRSAMVTNEVVDLVAAHADVASAKDAAAVAALAREDRREIAVVVLVAEGLDVDETTQELARSGTLGQARLVVATGAARHADLAKVVDEGLLVAVVMFGTPGIVGWIVAAELRLWMLEHGFDPLRLPAQPGAPGQKSAMMETLQASEEDLLEDLRVLIEKALGERALIELPAGVRLTRQGEKVYGVYVVLEGKVALTRTVEGSDLLLHHASTGPVVGLLALTRRRNAFFTATTTTDVVALHLSVEQLDRAMRLQPNLGILLAALSMQSLTLRLLRSEELQFERNELNRQLEAERKRLSKALKQLEEARLELVSQARFATLGELSAGVAHELNNPVAAISGVAGHIPADLTSAIVGHPQEALLADVIRAASARESVSTSSQRAVRRAVEAATGDIEFAWAMVNCGILDEALAVAAHKQARDAALGVAGLASAVRNIDVATIRIRELVTSLRAYSRPESELVENVDVRQTIDDALHLLSHRLHDVEVVLDYSPLPTIAAHPAQLGQVWTNILVNAVDAIGGTGRIDIETSTAGEDAVRVLIRDNGPGIPADVLPRIFEPRFSTKKGAVRYGLGLGMGISRRIVEEHGGSLSATSRPGCTEMVVTLPVERHTKEEA